VGQFVLVRFEVRLLEGQGKRGKTGETGEECDLFDKTSFSPVLPVSQIVLVAI
jgi:hypothetical protein